MKRMDQMLLRGQEQSPKSREQAGKRVFANQELSPYIDNPEGPYTPIYFLANKPPEEGIGHAIFRTLRGGVISKKVSSGNFGETSSSHYFVVGEDGRKIDLVKKSFFDNNEDTNTVIKDSMRIQSALQDVGVPTLPLYTDGKSLFSPNLNTENITALSGNNDAPQDFNPNIIKQIKNIDALLDSLMDIVVKASKAKVALKWDCLFFLYNNKEETVEPIIGDFDLLHFSKNGHLSTNSLNQITDNIRLFINAYIKTPVMWEYLDKIDKRLAKPYRIPQNHIFTDSGLKHVNDCQPTDFIFQIGKMTDDIPKSKLAQIIYMQANEKYTEEQIATDPREITENTRCYLGDLTNNDEDILNSRQSPLRIIGKVFFQKTSTLKRIPDNIVFDGNVLISGAPNLNSIGENVTFLQDVDIIQTPLLKRIPESTSFYDKAAIFRINPSGLW